MSLAFTLASGGNFTTAQADCMNGEHHSSCGENCAHMKKTKKHASQAKGGDAASGTVVGSPITLSAMRSLAEVAKNPAQFKDQEVLIQAQVSKVCEKSGCWMKVQEGKTEMRVVFKEDRFNFPSNAVNKKAKIQGTLKVYGESDFSLHASGLQIL